MENTTRKKARVEKSDISRNDDATQSDENTLYFNYILPNELLDKLFRYLSFRNLISAVMVCRSWSETANKEKLRRGPCHCLINLEKMDSLLSYIENIRIIPLTGFFLIPLSFKQPGIEVPNVRIETYKVIEPFMETWDTININVTHEMSNCKSNHEASFMMMIFCRHSQNSFTLTKNFISFVQERKTFKIASTSAIMLEDTYVPYKTIRRMHERILEPNCIAVVITGPVQTWFVILDDKYSTQEHIEARLQLFKDEVKLKKHSLGFMFTHMRCGPLQRKMAMTTFKRLFPEISLLVGCVVHDIDHRNLGKTTDEVNEEKNDKDDHECKVFQSRSMDICIMFLILTYG